MTTGVKNTTLDSLSNLSLRHYLEMMQNTETPPIMHAWALIGAASACLTRRRWFDVGSIRYWPNQFIMLTGPAGVRKSTAIAFAKQLVRDIPGFKFGPNNTGGRMQGLLSAMAGFSPREQTEEEAAVKDVVDAMFGNINLNGATDLNEPQINRFDKSALWVAESEMVTFIGRNQDEFITFLADIWDCPPDFKYQVKRETTFVEYPCLNIVGGITPMHITTYLPPQAIGQGFSSRVIFVYAGMDENKKIPWPEPLDEQRLRDFKHVMQAIYSLESGPFGYTKAAQKAIIELYGYTVPIDDVRFQHYAQRRQAHLVKVAMALAALRLDDTITDADVLDAHSLLTITEARMPDALGMHGLNDSALAKARVKEFLMAQTQPSSIARIMLAAGSDVKKVEVQRAITELQDAGQIVQLQLQDDQGVRRVGFAWVRQQNAFKQNASVRVSYALDERTGWAAAESAREDAAARAVHTTVTDAVSVNRERLHAAELAAEQIETPPTGVSVAERLAQIRALKRNQP